MTIIKILTSMMRCANIPISGKIQLKKRGATYLGTTPKIAWLPVKDSNLRFRAKQTRCSSLELSGNLNNRKWLWSLDSLVSGLWPGRCLVGRARSLMESPGRQTPQAVRFLLTEVYVFFPSNRVSSPAAFPSPSSIWSRYTTSRPISLRC